MKSVTYADPIPNESLFFAKIGRFFRECLRKRLQMFESFSSTRCALSLLNATSAASSFLAESVKRRVLTNPSIPFFSSIVGYVSVHRVIDLSGTNDSIVFA